MYKYNYCFPPQLDEFLLNLEGMFGMVCLKIDAVRSTHIFPGPSPQ